MGESMVQVWEKIGRHDKVYEWLSEEMHSWGCRMVKKLNAPLTAKSQWPHARLAWAYLRHDVTDLGHSSKHKISYPSANR
jgi:hypothetical protein